MLDLKDLKVGQTIYYVTEDVSGVTLMPCTVTGVEADHANAATVNGIAVEISKSNLTDYYVSPDEADSRTISKKKSWWGREDSLPDVHSQFHNTEMMTCECRKGYTLTV